MAGRKGQRGSGGHNKKSAEEHERDGTRSHAESPEPAAGSVVNSLGDLGIDANNFAGRLSSVCESLLAAIENDPIDKEARLSFTAYWDRLYRLAADLARETPKDDTPKRPDDWDGPSLELLDRNRNGNGTPARTG